MSTTDLAEADKIAAGTFRGRTLASQFGIVNISSNLGDFPQLTGENYLRLRGDVTLTATISGTAADNRISGKIENLESFSNSKGIWEDYARISGALTLQATGIDAPRDISKASSTPPLCRRRFLQREATRETSTDRLADLEAAGIWYLQDGRRCLHSAALHLSIVGSFGAALVREDGSYGVEVGPVGD